MGTRRPLTIVDPLLFLFHQIRLFLFVIRFTLEAAKLLTRVYDTTAITADKRPDWIFAIAGTLKATHKNWPPSAILTSISVNSPSES